MRELSSWLQRNRDNVLGNLAANLIWFILGLVVVAAVIFWGVVISLPGPVIFLISLGVATLLLWIAVAIRRLLSGSPAHSESVSVMEFSPSRKQRDYVQMVQGAREVWTLWNSGGGLKRAHELPKLLPYLERVLLPYPHYGVNPALAPLALAAETTEHKESEIRELSKADVADAILAVTRDVHDYNRLHNGNVEVRWRIGQGGSLLTICGDWVFVEQFFPALGATDRPGYKALRSEFPELWDKLRGAYRYMWEHAAAADFATLERFQRIDALSLRGAELRSLEDYEYDETDVIRWMNQIGREVDLAKYPQLGTPAFKSLDNIEETLGRYAALLDQMATDLASGLTK
jgi:hypothetical protein